MSKNLLYAGLPRRYHIALSGFPTLNTVEAVKVAGRLKQGTFSFQAVLSEREEQMDDRGVA
jgi:hypothetical protein